MNINTDFKLELHEKGNQRRKEQQLKKSERKIPRDDYCVELDRIIETIAGLALGRGPNGSGMDEMEREEEQEI